jgi:hypothetical protein
MKPDKIRTMDHYQIKTEISRYLKKYIARRKEDKDYNQNAFFKMKAPNFSTEVSETLTKMLIEEKALLTDFPETIYSVSRPSENDIRVNGKYVIEVKGTTSNDGLITLSKNNLDCYAWVWLDFNLVVNEESNYAVIHVLKRPSLNITPKFIKTNNEKKLNLKKMCRDIKNGIDYEKFEYDVWNFKMMQSGDVQNEFFEIA